MESWGCGSCYVCFRLDDTNPTSKVVLTLCLHCPLQPRRDMVFVSVKDVICIGVTDTLSWSKRALHTRINATASQWKIVSGVKHVKDLRNKCLHLLQSISGSFARQFWNNGNIFWHQVWRQLCEIAAFASRFGCLPHFHLNPIQSETIWANKMIFTSSSVTSFQNHRLQEKSIQNASLAEDVCSVRMLTFPPRMSPHSTT